MSKKCLPCSPKVCRECWLYVVADRDGSGPVKVGISFMPTQRLSQHRKKTKRDLSIHLRLPFRCEFKAMDAEEACLSALSESRVYGDWFALPVDEVISIVKRRSGRG
jgi:hypothetical protein